MSNYFFLRYVPEDKTSFVERCGFREFAATSAPAERIWFLPNYRREGPLADIPANRVEGFLLRNGAARQVFVCRMWGAEPD